MDKANCPRGGVSSAPLSAGADGGCWGGGGVDSSSLCIHRAVVALWLSSPSLGSSDFPVPLHHHAGVVGYLLSVVAGGRPQPRPPVQHHELGIGMSLPQGSASVAVSGPPASVLMEWRSMLGGAFPGQCVTGLVASVTSHLRVTL